MSWLGDLLIHSCQPGCPLGSPRSFAQKMLVSRIPSLRSSVYLRGNCGMLFLLCFAFLYIFFNLKNAWTFRTSKKNTGNSKHPFLPHWLCQLLASCHTISRLSMHLPYQEPRPSPLATSSVPLVLCSVLLYNTDVLFYCTTPLPQLSLKPFFKWIQESFLISFD